MRCSQCETELRSPEVIYDKHDAIKEIINIKFGGEKLKVDIQEVIRDLEPYYVINYYILGNSLILAVDDQIGAVTESYQKARDIILSYIPGMQVRLSHQYIRGERILTLSVRPQNKRTEQSRRLSIILFFLTFMSMFLAGVYDYTAMQTQVDAILDGFVFNSESVFFALQFSGTLLFILIVKDFQPFSASLRKRNSLFTSFFIPAPPVFELGTLGSYVAQSSIPEDKEQMFRSAFFGPFIGWIVALIIFVLTYSWGSTTTLNDSYTSNSVIYNKDYSSLFMWLIDLVTGNTGGSYVFHPITLGALAGLYIIGLYFLPVSHLTGGYLVKAVSGDSWHSLATWIAIILLMRIKLYFIGLMFLSLHILKRQPIVLNEESQVSKKSKLLMIIALLIAVSSFPLSS